MIEYDDINEVNDVFNLVLASADSDEALSQAGREWVSAGYEIALREGWSAERAAEFRTAVEAKVNARLEANARARSKRAAGAVAAVLTVATVAGACVLWWWS